MLVDQLCLGAPKFADRRAAIIAAELGPLPAWRFLLKEPGSRAANDVNGSFAVGLRDERGRTFLAVDRFAAHSVCYRVLDGELFFAESAVRLAAIPPAAELDPQAIFDYLYFHAIPSPRTIFKGVYRLPPAHCAWFEDAQLTVSRYWSPAFGGREPAQFDALAAEFRQCLKEGVAAELDGSTPACFLSGGTDSSTVAGMIREVSGQPAHCYSIGFEAEGYDEMAYARLAARHFGAVHHEYYVTPDDLVRHIPAVAASFDQPFGNSSVLPAYVCALKARDDGVTRLLAGDGGDELFGGNARYAKQRIFGLYGHLPAALRRGLLEPFFGLPGVARAPMLKKGGSYIEQARVPMPGRLQMYNLLLRLGVDEVLTPEFLAGVDTGGPARHQQTVWATAGDTSELNRTLAYDWRYTLAESDLPKVRGATQLAGVSVGYPMLDHALLDLSLRLPDHYKLNGLKLRWFFKEALRGFLPDEILAKKKQGFGLPFGVWATRHEGLRRIATDSLGSLSTRGIVRPAFIRQVLDVHMTEHPGYYGEMVWILMMFEHWLQYHQQDFRYPS